MKRRGQIRLTAEVLHKMLELPKEVEIINVSFDDKREIINVKIRSEEVVSDLTHETGEGMEFPTSNLDYYFEKKVDKDA